jgi:hypothetical protein
MKPREGDRLVLISKDHAEMLDNLARLNNTTPSEQMKSLIEEAIGNAEQEMAYSGEWYYHCDHDTLLKSDAGEYRCRWCGRVIALAEVEVPF